VLTSTLPSHSASEVTTLWRYKICLLLLLLYAEITELSILSSELSWCKLSPMLASAHYSCSDNAIGLAGRQLGGNFLITTNVCRSNVMYNPHKLNTDSNRNTKSILKIKIAVENASLCGNNMLYKARCFFFNSTFD